jgi:hypothetical protein
MYASRVFGEQVFVCAGGDMVKLSWCCGCVHGASGRCSGVSRFCSSSQCLVTIDMTSCGLVCNSLVVGCVRVVTLGWSRALGFMPAFIFRSSW